MSLGKSFDKQELNIKMLKCLDRTWQPNVTAISESKDLTSMTTTSLFGKLREHELEMNRLVVKRVRTNTARALHSELVTIKSNKTQVIVMKIS